MRYHMIVHGKVQGVGFRKFTQRHANLFHITGWVCNKVDRTVEIEAQGSMESMKQFVSAIKKGPSRSRVERLEFLKKHYRKDYQTFSIK